MKARILIIAMLTFSFLPSLPASASHEDSKVTGIRPTDDIGAEASELVTVGREETGNICSIAGSFHKNGSLRECALGTPLAIGKECHCPGTKRSGTVASKSQDKDPKFAKAKDHIWLIGEKNDKQQGIRKGLIKTAKGTCILAANGSYTCQTSFGSWTEAFFNTKAACEKNCP